MARLARGEHDRQDLPRHRRHQRDRPRHGAAVREEIHRRAPRADVETLTADGFETTFATNHLGPFR
jgi:NAD(P)-dependent dehydrogenase (short-subunit alcohol dehydrogenase family)